MKRYVQYFLLGIFTYMNAVLPQQISGRISTSAYSWEKYDTIGRSNVITRVFQTIQLNGTYKDLSLHTSINGAVGGAAKFTDDAQIRIYNAYLKWRNIGGVLDLHVGRIPVFAGVGNGTVDGAQLKTKLYDEDITLSGYGGVNVPADLRSKGFDDVNKNFFIGGQVIGYFLDAGRVSVSYMNRQRSLDSYNAIRPDTVFNAVTLLIQPDARKEQIIGGDIRYAFTGKYSAYERFEYDLNSENILRSELDAQIDVLHNIALTGTFIYRKPKVPYHSFFSLFKVEAVTEYEGGIEYFFDPSINAFGRFAFVQYDDDDSKRYTVGINTKYGSCSYSGSDGYSGELSSFSIDGQYPLFKRMLIPTISASLSSYRLDKASSKENALSGSIGTIVRPLQSFSFDVQVQWLKNRIVDSDIRAFGRVNYWFNHNFSRSQEKGIGE